MASGEHNVFARTYCEQLSILGFYRPPKNQIATFLAVMGSGLDHDAAKTGPGSHRAMLRATGSSYVEHSGV